jgi:hypothetical protein
LDYGPWLEYSVGGFFKAILALKNLNFELLLNIKIQIKSENL